MGVLGKIDRRGRVRVHALQSAPALELFGLTVDEALEQVWSLDGRGRLRGGAEAVNAALSAALGVPIPLWLYRIPGIRWCQDRLYRAVAENRYRLPGSSGSCTLDP